MKIHHWLAIATISVWHGTVPATAADLRLTTSPATGNFTLVDSKTSLQIAVEADSDPSVLRAASDLAADFERVTGFKPPIVQNDATNRNIRVLIGTLGQSKLLARLAAQGKLDTNGISGGWESYVLQVVANPLPQVDRALVIAGSDRRGTIYGIYQLSEMIGVSPWYWWADVPVQRQAVLALQGDLHKQGPPAVKYRGLFLNDEDWGLRPWAAQNFDPKTGNIGPKTYAKIFELLLRLHANYLWPAMHPGTTAFNTFPENAKLANEYGIVMGSSHCEQMLRNNISEWDEKKFGDYNFVTNPDGVLKYWDERVRANGKFENIYTLGMRGIHDSGMPGGGTEREKAARLETIIADQRQMLAHWVNPEVAEVPQIFCPYKEVLPLYRLMKQLPDDITIVWPDDNYGYIRQFSDSRERGRSGGAGVYYHVSYWGAPRDYLWLCSTPPALIAEEMTKAYAYGANRVWVLNVGDLKPAELDIEFFLKLAWKPDIWTGTNTYELFSKPLARDFGASKAPALTSIMAEYYRLNFHRKPEHIGFPSNHIFSPDEARQRLSDWQHLVAQVNAVGKTLPPETQDAFFELIAYPVKAAAAINEKCLAGSQTASDEIDRLTDFYNHGLANGKWDHMMSDNPRQQLDFAIATNAPAFGFSADGAHPRPNSSAANRPAEFVEQNHLLIMEAEHASKIIPGAGARWGKLAGLGYNGEAMTIFPATAPACDEVEQVLSKSPCLRYDFKIQTTGDWRFTVRALPTFSVEAGKPQRYAIAVDQEAPQIIALPVSTSEHDRRWQQDVLSNTALTSSTHAIGTPGEHTLKIWMVDPGIVLDTIAGQTGNTSSLGYVWPDETGSH